MFVMATLLLLAAMFLIVARAAMGPTVFDRILAANAFGTQTVLLIAVAGFLTGRPEWLDLALVYTMMSFIGVIAVLRFARFGNFVAEDKQT